VYKLDHPNLIFALNLNQLKPIFTKKYHTLQRLNNKIKDQYLLKILQNKQQVNNLNIYFNNVEKLSESHYLKIRLTKVRKGKYMILI
jgi:hypothetical protein